MAPPRVSTASSFRGRDLRLGVPAALSDLVLFPLATKEPARPASAAGVLAALARLRDTPPRAGEPSRMTVPPGPTDAQWPAPEPASAPGGGRVPSRLHARRTHPCRVRRGVQPRRQAPGHHQPRQGRPGLGFGISRVRTDQSALRDVAKSHPDGKNHLYRQFSAGRPAGGLKLDL
jgi:hypothetical protein